MGFLRPARLGSLVCALAVAAQAASHTPSVSSSSSSWELALRARTSLEQQASGTRTRLGYAHVEEAFRTIYYDNPRDRHAADAVNAVAELLAEQGRELAEEKSLHAAIRQFEFLRTQYPTSPLREAALLAEARIERDDLKDAPAARERYTLLIAESPRSESGHAARAELAELSAVKPAHREESALTKSELTTERVKAAMPSAAKIARVTGIRHWSTATYTRVAIDLGDEVKFEAARVPNPDRIYFDLHGARLAPELIGKSFVVTDDGFLKRIRAAQEEGDLTRVVLDVSDVSEYSAFLLPNPYRLIIDIHGKRDPSLAAQAAAAPQEMPSAELPPAAASNASAAANTSGLPAMAPTDGGEAVRPLAPAESRGSEPATPNLIPPQFTPPQAAIPHPR